MQRIDNKMIPIEILRGAEWRLLRRRLNHDLVGNRLLNELDAIEIRLNSGTCGTLPEDWPVGFSAVWTKACAMVDRLLAEAPYSLSVEAKMQELHLTDPMYQGLRQVLEREWSKRNEILADSLAEAKQRMGEAEKAYNSLLRVHGDMGLDALHDVEERTLYVQSVHGLRCAIDRLRSTLSSMGQF